MSQLFHPITLATGETCWVDEIDSDLGELRWCRKKRDELYAVRREADGTKTQIHRVILSRMLGRKLERGECVDHINRDTLDNRRCNLRLCTHAENMRNRKWPSKESRSTSAYRGVFWSKAHGRWRAAIKTAGKRQHLGLFSDEIEAAKSYDEAARRLHGEFAVLNFQ